MRYKLQENTYNGTNGTEKTYIEKSLNQFVLGHYTEDVTLLGTGMQVGAGILNVDLPMDIRDISADIRNWEWSWEYAGQTVLDGIGLLPVVGTLKYTDEVGALVKPVVKHGDEVVLAGEKTIKYADEAKEVIQQVEKNTSKNVDKTIGVTQGAGKADLEVNSFDKTGKLKSNNKYKTGEFDYLYETDDMGRISKFKTDNLQLTERESRLPHNSDTPEKLDGDHAGHLAGDVFSKNILN